jgi:hypothetical protein
MLKELVIVDVWVLIESMLSKKQPQINTFGVFIFIVFVRGWKFVEDQFFEKVLVGLIW